MPAGAIRVQVRTGDPLQLQGGHRRANRCVAASYTFIRPSGSSPSRRQACITRSGIRRDTMNKPMSVLVFAIAVLSASMALAQSSGNFDAAVSPTVCTLNSSTGTLSPLCTPTADGTECVLLDTTIKTSNGNGVTLLITPSAVTGLFTDTKLSSTLNTATADIGIQVCVTVAGGKVLPGGTETSCVVYDQRFQQISNTLFQNVA